MFGSQFSTLLLQQGMLSENPLLSQIRRIQRLQGNLWGKSTYRYVSFKEIYDEKTCLCSKTTRLNTPHKISTREEDSVRIFIN